VTDGFITRWVIEIRHGFKNTFISPLEYAYHNSPSEFIGRLFALGGMALLLLDVIILAILNYFFHDFTFFGISLNVSNIFNPIFFFSFIIAMIGAIILSFLRRGTQDSDSDEIVLKKSEKKVNKNKNIFVVHGHDSKIKEEVTTYLRTLGLNPIVLQEVPNLGKTIIEKVEHYVALTSFAIVILTKDDFGVSKIDFNIEELISVQLQEIDIIDLETNVRNTCYDELNEEEVAPFFELTHLSRTMLNTIKPRARQNVIFELGITMGVLHRDNVRVIYEEGVELPTDILGYAYTALDDKWKENILEELKAMNIL
jgi:hypothetical protein